MLFLSALNIVEPQNRRGVAWAMVEDIRKKGNAFTAGDVGYRFLLKALAMEGYSDVIYDVNNQSERPGYGYQLRMGATSLTEKWDASVGYLGSQNHFMLGQINEWFFNDLLGIGVEPDGAGFRKFVVKPVIIEALKWVKGSYNTTVGLISLEWKCNRGHFSLNLEIPANATATVHIPAEEESSVMESGRHAHDAEGVEFTGIERGRAVYQVASGRYKFVSRKIQWNG